MSSFYQGYASSQLYVRPDQFSANAKLVNCNNSFFFHTTISNFIYISLSFLTIFVKLIYAAVIAFEKYFYHNSVQKFDKIWAGTSLEI